MGRSDLVILYYLSGPEILYFLHCLVIQVDQDFQAYREFLENQQIQLHLEVQETLHCLLNLADQLLQV